MDDTILDLATRSYDTVLLTEGGSPIGRLRLQAEIHTAHLALSAHYKANAQAEDAVYAAADHVVHNYPSTLGAVLSAEKWQGYPALDDKAGNTSAAAHLGDGFWVHHATEHIPYDDDPERDRWKGHAVERLTLIAPCSCGCGYLTRAVATEDELLEAVRELTREPRSILKHNCPHDCGSVQP